MKSKWKEFSDYFRAFSSEALNDTMRATEQLASTSLLLLNRKPDEERKAILARAQEMTEKPSDVLCSEIPLVASIALLTEVRTLERLIQLQADERRRARGEGRAVMPEQRLSLVDELARTILEGVNRTV